MGNGDGRRKLAIHGPVVDLQSTVPMLDESLNSLLSNFEVPGWPENFQPISGTIHPYNESEVLSGIPESARHFARTADMVDVYEDGDVFWLVDDRWGMSRIDIPRSQWQSWIIPQPKLDCFRVAELSVLCPLAQLLRPRGMHLLPAISAVRDGFAVMIICPFGIEPELTAMINSGYKIIGQRWTALREEDGRIALLHLPGRIERFTTPRLRYNQNEQQESWLDVTQQHPGSWQNHAFCDAVLVAEPGRRAKAHLRSADAVNAIEMLRREWPIVDLDRTRKGSPLPGRLAQHCRVFEVQLSRNTKDLLALLTSVRHADLMPTEQNLAA
jgi:hypothetical protein